MKGAKPMLFNNKSKNSDSEEKADDTVNANESTAETKGQSTLGENIALLRKEKGLTQEELSELLSVSAQAVSKWENNLSCPDIMLLPQIAMIFNVTVDELLSKNKPNHKQKSNQTASNSFEPYKTDDPKVKATSLRVIIHDRNGKETKITVPMRLVKVAIKLGTGIPQVMGSLNITEAQITEIINLVEMGVTGKLIDIQTGDGETIEILAE